MINKSISDMIMEDNKSSFLELCPKSLPNDNIFSLQHCLKILFPQISYGM